MIRSLPDRLKRFLLSPKTVIALICAVGIFCVIGFFTPQLTEKPPEFFEAWRARSPVLYGAIDFLQFNRIFTSVWFLILVALISSSLALSAYNQARLLMKSGKDIRKNISKIPFKDSVTIESAQDSGLELEELDGEMKEVFKGRGYRPNAATKENGYFVFEKNRIGRWGGLIFHVGLLVIIIAALYGLAFHKRGYVQMVQTATFQGREGEWTARREGVFAKDFNLGFRVYLKEFTPTYWENGEIKDMESTLIVTDDKGDSRELHLSLRGSVEFRGVNMYQSEYYGYSTGLILERQGEEPIITYFLLDAPVQMGKPFVNKTDFPTTGYIFDIKFHPDLAAHSPYAVLPGLDLTVTEKGGQRFKGTVLLNQKVQLGDNALTFAKIHYWTGLNFTQNYGLPLVYTGFALSTLGAMVIFMLSYKEIHVMITEEEGRIRLTMGGRAKTDQAIFSEEFTEIAEMVRKVLGKHGNHPIA